MSELSRADAIQILEKLSNFEGIFEYIENHSVSVQDALLIAIDSLKTDEAYNLLHEKIDFIQIPDSGTNEDVLNDILRQAFPRVVFVRSHDISKKTQAMTIHMTDEWLEMPYER